MKRRELLTMTAMSPWLGACAGTPGGAGGGDVRGIGMVGMVVEDSLAHGASEKKGVMGVSDTGRQLFAHAGLTARGGGTSSYGGATVPRWVRVTWREGADEAHGLYWTTGTVVGDYTVPVLERIPPQAFDLARAGKKRPLVLRFRIRDDGVDFGWMVDCKMACRSKYSCAAGTSSQGVFGYRNPSPLKNANTAPSVQ